ncbi:hypothetical protein ACSEE7_11640 [Halomonas cupida]|uniref:hypothetical protein n=1 Tax=Halomonas cupida TaxID=44933 RepID=UPI003EFAE4A9
MTALAWQRTKLIALISIFVAPMLVAWIMAEWRIGIPVERTAHGSLDSQLPVLSEWPIEALETGQGVTGSADEDSQASGEPMASSRAWRLVFDCGSGCQADADRWWRLHRALGKEAHRLTRLRIGGTPPALPGESLWRWSTVPEWSGQGRAWLLDPVGNVAVAYADGTETRAVMDDIEHLFKRNPEWPAAARHQQATPGVAGALDGPPSMSGSMSFLGGRVDAVAIAGAEALAETRPMALSSAQAFTSLVSREVAHE